MTSTIRTICTVGPDGNVTVPVGREEAGSKVEVVISPQRELKLARDMTSGEYLAFIDSIAGSWEGEFPEIEDRPPEPVDPL